ncbi:MAG: energy transducer TonB [Jhaorihella sp.]
MDTGTRISAIAHLALIGWVLFGAAFEPHPLPFQVHEVSVISEQEFAAMTAAPITPEPTAEPAAPAAPDPAGEAPQVAALPDILPERTQPDPAPEPEPEATPERLPEPTPPEPAPPAPVPDMQPPEPQVTELPPDPQARPRPVERVAPQPVAPPPPEARPDEIEQTQVVPEEGAAERREPAEATAPEEATDRIVTEADAGRALAPSASPRPRVRPARPAPQAAAQPAERADTRAAVNDALAEALGSPDAAPAPAPSGPPLTAGDRDALRVAVSNCWNVGSLSSEALRTTVVVTVSMAQDGKPETGTIRMLSSSGGSGDAAKQAFEAARRAIIRCGASGFDLPAEKYDQWREIEMTFNPERMRIK